MKHFTGKERFTNWHFDRKFEVGDIAGSFVAPRVRDPQIRTLFAILAMTVLIEYCWAAEKEWEKKPYTDWSAEELYAVLNESPWVALCPAMARRMNVPRSWGGRSPAWVPTMYRIQLLTAKPIREAYLHWVAFGLTSDATMLGKAEAEGQKERLDDFVRTNPNHLLIKGDDKWIVVALSLLSQPDPNICGELCPPHWMAGPPDNVSASRLSDLLAATSLTTDKGKKVALFKYQNPGPDQIAEFFFSRTLPDGTPFISAGDKELRFKPESTTTK